MQSSEIHFDRLKSLFLFDFNQFPINDLHQILDEVDKASICGELESFNFNIDSVLGNIGTLPRQFIVLTTIFRSNEYSFLEKVEALERLIPLLLYEKENDRLLTLQVCYIFIATLIQLAIVKLSTMGELSKLPKSYTNHIRKLLSYLE